MECRHGGRVIGGRGAAPSEVVGTLLIAAFIGLQRYWQGGISLGAVKS